LIASERWTSRAAPSADGTPLPARNPIIAVLKADDLPQAGHGEDLPSVWAIDV
jgi:hypothetical protein